VVCLYQLAELPAPGPFLLLWLGAAALLWWPVTRRFALFVLLFAAGFSWAGLDAWQRLNPALPLELEGIPLQISGVIDSLPQREGRILRFVLATEQAQQADGTAVVLPQRVRLAWYGQSPQNLAPGQRWQLLVKLKRPWSLRNPGSFDYEGWLFQQGIRATGYVRAGSGNQLLDSDGGGHRLLRLRYTLQQMLAQQLGEHPMRGIITALAIGERSAIDDQQWQVLLASGTNHLVAISGLHVGLVAGLIFLLLRRLWRLCPGCCQRLPAPRAAALAAMLAALGYAALAGFSIPTQRALIMLAIVLGALWWQRPIQRGRVLLLALWGVLLLDPTSVLAAGFWLSFAAVAWILYGMGGRLSARNLWWRWGRVQFLVAIGLLPLLLLFFQQGSLSAPLANLLAVPLVSLVVVPLTLLAVLLIGPLPGVAGFLLGLAAGTLQWLWPLLQWLGEALPPMTGAASGWLVLPAILGLVWLFAPHGWPLRTMGLLLCLPLLWPSADSLSSGTARLTLLDVGQGLAAVVQTRHHTLLFDTGPAFPSGFDTGEAVVVPFLREAGIDTVDALILSHGSNDHAGGLASVLHRVEVGRILRGATTDSALPVSEACRRGQAWQWDGVEFRLLHPQSRGRLEATNNRSCVLRVSAGKQSLLLAADIEAEAERALLESGEVLRANVIVAPHHGSNSSSTSEFITAVHPQLVLFSVGYRNRYGFPDSRVIERYRSLGAGYYRTDRDGALRIELGNGDEVEVEAYRRQQQRLWHTNM